MTSKRKPNPTKRDSSQPPVKANRGGDKELIAQRILRPTVQAASTIREYSQGPRELDISGLIDALTAQTNAATDGDLDRAEAMLTAQAHTLDAIFNNLARRAINQKYMDNLDRCLKLALRAQSQSRATWETLSTIKNPPMAGYVGQANIAHGHQQVNNAPSIVGEAPRTRENGNPQNELLEAKDDERLDTGATGTAGQADPAMATLGPVHRTKDADR